MIKHTVWTINEKAIELNQGLSTIVRGRLLVYIVYKTDSGVKRMDHRSSSDIAKNVQQRIDKSHG